MCFGTFNSTYADNNIFKTKKCSANYDEHLLCFHMVFFLNLKNLSFQFKMNKPHRCNRVVL